MYYPTDFISVKMAAIILGQSDSSGKRRRMEARLKLEKGRRQNITIKEFCSALKRDLQDDMKKLNDFTGNKKR